MASPMLFLGFITLLLVHVLFGHMESGNNTPIPAKISMRKFDTHLFWSYRMGIDVYGRAV